MAEIAFKQKFIDRYKELTDWDVYCEACDKHLRKAIRVNTLKISISTLKKRLEKQGFTLTQVPWCKEGFWIIGERTDLGNLLEHALGYFYIQEAASMIPPVVLGVKEHEAVLDVAAAPGSKASQIAQYMKNTGILIANDVTGNRLASLGINLQRCGAKNALVMKSQGQHIRGTFDKILLDAPCTGTGTIMKSYKVVEDWSPGAVDRVTNIQKKLILRAFENLKKGGTLVYSTCTMEPQEDEGIVSFLLEKFDNAKVQEIKLNIKRSKPVLSFGKEKYNPEVKKCLRIWPQDNNTEGFFIAKIKKV